MISLIFMCLLLPVNSVFIIKDNKSMENLNSYDAKRHTLIINKNNNKFFIDYKHNFGTLVNNDYIESLSCEYNNTQKTNIKSLKLGELQKIATGKGISVKKQGKKGPINKTKKELINEIQSS